MGLAMTREGQQCLDVTQTTMTKIPSNATLTNDISFPKDWHKTRTAAGWSAVNQGGIIGRNKPHRERNKRPFILFSPKEPDTSNILFDSFPFTSPTRRQDGNLERTLVEVASTMPAGLLN